MTTDLRAKPWNTETLPDLLDEPIGMVGPEERRAYYWLAKNFTTRDGCVVDAGAFLGASTFCLAAGAQDADLNRPDKNAFVHAYDYFKVVDKYVGEAITKDFRPISVDESYLDIFLDQTKRYQSLIEPHAGDFLEQQWVGEQIDLLFIDVAKTQSLNSHCVDQFFGHLVPGHSILIHQDYFHCWHPYIHISMQFFSDEFELVDEHVPHQSRVWQLKKELSKEKLSRIADYDLTKAERIALLEEQVHQSSEFYAPMIRVVKIWQRCIDGDFDLASQDLAELRADFDIDNMPILWARQALDVERHIKNKL